MAARRQKQPAPEGDRDAQQPRRIRNCHTLFVLGSGFEPSEFAGVLLDQYQQDAGKGFDFTRAKPVVRQARQWKPNDKVGFRKCVMECVAAWFETLGTQFDANRILIRDYQDEADRHYAVAGYFPRSVGVAVSDDDSDDFDPSDETAIDLTESERPARRKPSDRVQVAQAMVREWSQRGLVRLKSISRRWWIVAAGSLFVVGLSAVVVPIAYRVVEEQIAAWRERARVEAEANASTAALPDEKADKSDEKKLPTVKFTLGALRVYTPEAGFFVAVDGEPVRDNDGQLAQTPCVVTTEVGSHRVTAFRDGFLDISRQVNVALDGEVEFASEEDENKVGSEMLTAPYLAAPIGKPIAMKNINSARPEIDPFVSANGLTLWFAGDRKEGRGMFRATRPTPYHDFEAPKIISRGPDLPASPSVSTDELQLVYSIPEKARLMHVTRPDAKSDFTDKKLLRQSEKEGILWPSAQILADATRVYWVEINDETLATWVMNRKDARGKFDNVVKVNLPGTHPCFSPDGLRQYEFDGTKVKRHRRANLQSKFVGEGQLIAELDLEGYELTDDHRQYFVSPDEQWLYYCDDPIDGGDLYMVRLSDGPQWGVKPTAKGISPKDKRIAKNTGETLTPDPSKPDSEPEMKPEVKPQPKPVDPRTLPLPYALFLKPYLALLSDRQYDDAEALLMSAKGNPDNDPFKELLAWDEAELKTIRNFWSDLAATVTKLKDGDPIRISGNAMKFVSFEEGVITSKLGASELKKKLVDLPPADLSGIFDLAHKEDGADPQAAFATFLLYDKQGVERTIKFRVDKAGTLGDTLLDHRARRRLMLAKAEFARKNYGNGVVFLKDVRDLAGARSDLIKEVEEMQAMLFSLVKWEPQGKRVWVIENGMFRASTERSENSILISSEEFEHFELSLEWQTEVAAQSQGGVYFNYPGKGDLYEKSYKIHVANDFGFKPDIYCTGALFAISQPTVNAVQKAGEWNTLKMRVQSGQVVVTINGKEVQKAGLNDSKVPSKGFVALDGGIGGITYRKVLLTELPPK